VERQRDPGDRSRVFVHFTGRHERELATSYAPLTTATEALLREYDEEQLGLIHGFLARLTGDSRAFLDGINSPPAG
jgi:DNA-binding MarR family transcriptional regulator